MCFYVYDKVRMLNIHVHSCWEIHVQDGEGYFLQHNHHDASIGYIGNGKFQNMTATLTYCMRLTSNCIIVLKC